MSYRILAMDFTILNYIKVDISKTLAHFTKISVTRNKRIRKRTRKEWKIYIWRGEPLRKNNETKKTREKVKKKERENNETFVERNSHALVFTRATFHQLF